MRFVMLHYHFLKSAGMAIEDMLRRSFEKNYASIDTEDRDGHMSTQALLALLNSNPHLKAVSSHQIRYPVPQVRGFMFCLWTSIAPYLSRAGSLSPGAEPTTRCKSVTRAVGNARPSWRFVRIARLR